MSCLIGLIVILTTLSSVYPMSGVKFYSYKSNGMEEIDITQPFTFSSLKLERSHPKIKIICHGWMGNIEANWYDPTGQNYINNGESNVIAIDWGLYADQNYDKAVKDVYTVGEFVGTKILELHQTTDIPLTNIHLIGHSLGAHVMGLVGQHIAKASGHRVGRITGLDPAGPAFDIEDNSKRLSSDDADFVDVIHTNTIFLGYKSTMGHVDFWPNGGRDQSGCNGDLSCSHNLAPLFFAESINSTSFPAWYCDSIELFNAGECFDNIMIYMGDGTPSNIRGEFFLNTNTDSPYGKGVDDY